MPSKLLFLGDYLIQDIEKLQNVPLVDKYSAYQSLDDEWQTIAVDLEIINTEGIEACKKVEPNLVMKGKDEVQDGWKGKIMPFDMIQKTFFGDDLNLIKIREELIEKHQSELAELIPEVEEGEEEIELTDEQKKQQKNSVLLMLRFMRIIKSFSRMKALM